eukprot:maker-scaffold1069_size64751-snap-gene-0.16 protein:Tk02465 transcript:maker-scaffold1069_size64751-snap-gene-0.16-mRNA-1 annotation:"hypothetical protein"
MSYGSTTSGSSPSSTPSQPSPSCSSPSQTVIEVQNPTFYRRMTPSEDLMATLLGIDVLVRQRQDLINQLVNHHERLSRKNEIGALTNFSQEIDRIMKMRGYLMKTPDVGRKLMRNPTKIPRGYQAIDS